MPLDINQFRAEKGGNPDLIRESEQRRFSTENLVDQIIELDNQWRKANFNMEQMQKEYGQTNKQVAQKKKESKGQDPCTEQIARCQELDGQIREAKIEVAQLMKTRDDLVGKVGNIVPDSVPISANEDDNKVERTWGEPNRMEIDSTPGKYHHNEVLFRIDGYDGERGIKVAGHRAYFLKGPGVMLNQALINYGQSFLNGRKYTLIQPPFFMKKSIMAQTAELADFDDQLYKVSTGKEDEEGFYLIATSEQPISTMHGKEWLQPSELPIRYGGNSSCFRKEAGAHGKDTWGIFRVHQFEKIEQFVICSPEESAAMHEEMIQVSEGFYQGLGLPYQVISIVSGALNGAAAKKYDLEAWFPGYNAYRELVSCSNCTDYQSRAANIRFGNKKQGDTEKKFVHMLNGTLCATERTLCCILENYQTETGLTVPEVLRPFMGGIDFIPYTKELSKFEESATKVEQAK